MILVMLVSGVAGGANSPVCYRKPEQSYNILRIAFHGADDHRAHDSLPLQNLRLSPPSRSEPLPAGFDGTACRDSELPLRSTRWVAAHTRPKSRMDRRSSIADIVRRLRIGILSWEICSLMLSHGLPSTLCVLTRNASNNLLKL